MRHFPQIARIRTHALKVADYAVTHPTAEMRAAFAALDDETWRGLVAAVRYPDDERLLSVIEAHEVGWVGKR